VVDARTLVVVVTQSGETADTIAALREAKARGARTIAVCNVVGSMATRIADGTVYTHAGPEIGVASTKAFTCQLVAFHLLALAIAQARGTLTLEDARAFIRELDQLPRQLEQALELGPAIEALSAHLQKHKDYFYFGRGPNYPIALEGALKLKELAYIHAQGYPAGEMKHGPIALLDEDMLVIALAPNDPVFEKSFSNIQEAKARGARLIVITSQSKAEAFDPILDPARDTVLTVSDAHALMNPVLLSLPMQFLAYHVANRRGCDVDQPRNLAKSVTVE
jgi:glucosamine--fructose-6-phosphate aminotransferase (isomerizing)